jgi:hypothetical protein
MSASASSSTASVSTCGLVNRLQWNISKYNSDAENSSLIDAGGVLLNDAINLTTLTVNLRLGGRLCVDMMFQLTEGAAGWMIDDERGVIVSQMSNSVVDDRSIAEVSIVFVNATDGNRSGIVRLCSASGSLSANEDDVVLLIAVPLYCRSLRARRQSSPLLVRFVMPQRQQERVPSTTRILRNMTLTRSLWGLQPTVQRVTPSSCSTSDDESSGGLLLFPVGQSAAARQAGIVFSNALLVLVGWVLLSVSAILVALVRHGRTSLREAMTEAHIATLAFPLISLVLIPITASTVSLWFGSGPSAAALEIFAALLGTLLIVGATGGLLAIFVYSRERLRPENVVYREYDVCSSCCTTSYVMTFFSNLQVTHWVARAADDVPFKRHSQLVLSETSLLWYYLPETALGVALGATDSILEAFVNAEVACEVTTWSGVATQLLLLILVLWFRPHGDVIGHWTASLSLFFTLTGVVFVKTNVSPSVFAALALCSSGILMVRAAVAIGAALIWVVGGPRRVLTADSTSSAEEQHPASLSSPPSRFTADQRDRGLLLEEGEHPPSTEDDKAIHDDAQPRGESPRTETIPDVVEDAHDDDDDQDAHDDDENSENAASRLKGQRYHGLMENPLEHFSKLRITTT